MQEDRQSIPYVGLEVVTYEGYDGLEVVPENGLEVMPSLEPGNNYSRYPAPENKPSSKSKRKKLGHSIRFWILVVSGIVVFIAVIIIAVVETAIDHKHKSSTTSTPADQRMPLPTATLALSFNATKTAAPTATKLALNCPAINKEIHNITVPNIRATKKDLPPKLNSQFKQFCSKSAVSDASNITLITQDRVNSSNHTFKTPSTVTTMDSCIETCASYNGNLTNAQIHDNVAFCYATWFNADQTQSNCYLYSIPEGFNFTEADILVENEGLNAMAVMVSFIGRTLITTFLSDNGDWAGGVMGDSMF